MVTYTEPQKWKKVTGLEERDVIPSLLILDLKDGKL